MPSYGECVMATKTENEKNGRWTIQFHRNDGKRPSIRLGVVGDRDAERFRFRIEELERAHQLGHPAPQSTLAWLKTISRKHHNRIAATGLIEANQTTTLGQLIEQFITTASVKETTKKKYRSSSKHLLEFFGEDRDPRSITPGDAIDFHNWMLTGRDYKLAKATAAKSIKHAKQFMAYAIDRRQLDTDPFTKLSGSCTTNRKRDHYITLDQAEQVLAACPDAQWRLLVALARFGGLRTPSESLALRWVDILWDRNRFIVNAKKTEHHDDGGIRTVPIFPELLPHLLAAHEQALPGDEFVITRYRDSEVNLGTQLARIVKRAGLTPWPKLWQNMRATRQTELMDIGFHPKCVTTWIGNSEKVMMEHYLQVTEEHYERAAKKAVQNPVQNPVQTLHADDRQRLPAIATPTSQSLVVAGVDDVMQLLAKTGNAWQNLMNGPGGT